MAGSAVTKAHLGAVLAGFPPLAALHQELLPHAQLAELDIPVQPDLVPAQLCIPATQLQSESCVNATRQAPHTLQVRMQCLPVQPEPALI